MATYSVTIRTYLLSFFKDEFGAHAGNGVKNDELAGDFYHPNEIIDQTYNELFKHMDLSLPLHDTIKKDFLKRFYNREIGFEVMSQFIIQLEQMLNTTCYNLIKFWSLVRDMPEEEWLQTANMSGTSKASGDSKSLGITSTQPQGDLAIIYPSGDGVIKYADALGENYGNQSQESLTNTVGSNTRPKWEMYNYYATLTDIEEQIFNHCELLFMQVF